MPDDLIKNLLSELAGSPKQPERARKNFSVYLDTELFSSFKKTCREQGHVPNKVLDKLISLYIAAVKENPGQGDT